MSSQRLSPLQYIRNFLESFEFFPLKSVSETRPPIRTQTWLIVAGIICMVSTIPNVECLSVDLASVNSAAVVKCAGHDIFKGDVGDLKKLAPNLGMIDEMPVSFSSIT